MGQHTWFEKDKFLYKKTTELYNKLDQHDENIIYLDDMEIYQINSEIDENDSKNKADYHDVFRTSKRNPDGTYTDDIITSKKECDKWLDDNSNYVYDLNKERLDKFWQEYPDGVIYFG